MGQTTFLWGVLIFGFAAYLGGIPAAVLLFAGCIVLVTAVLSVAAGLDWLAKQLKRPSRRL
jgi:anaerobic C4-dicarboxylate transporter